MPEKCVGTWLHLELTEPLTFFNRGNVVWKGQKCLSNPYKKKNVLQPIRLQVSTWTTENKNIVSGCIICQMSINIEMSTIRRVKRFVEFCNHSLFSRPAWKITRRRRFIYYCVLCLARLFLTKKRQCVVDFYFVFSWTCWQSIRLAAQKIRLASQKIAVQKILTFASDDDRFIGGSREAGREGKFSSSCIICEVKSTKEIDNKLIILNTNETFKASPNALIIIHKPYVPQAICNVEQRHPSCGFVFKKWES